MEGKGRTSISIKDIEKCIKEILFEKDILPLYTPMSNGLYELPGNIITNKKRT